MNDVKITQQKLENITNLAKQKKYCDAIKLCNEIITEYPNERAGYRKRAYVYARMKDFNKALDDINIIINWGSNEPDDYFTRGRWNLNLSNFEEAIKDFLQVIKIENKMETKYYTESAYFYRAYAYLLEKNYRMALQDCTYVREGFGVHLLGKMVSREDIQSEANFKLKENRQ